MKQTGINHIILTILVLFCPTLFAASPVWKVSNGADHLFIGGTIHVLAPSDYPLPSAFEHAYETTDMLVLEANVNEAQTPEFQQQLFQQMSYPSGQSLLDLLQADTIKKLTAYCRERGVPLKQLERFKPGMLTVMMTVAELQRLGLAGIGVDQHFNLRAVEEKRAMDFLESVESQLDLIINMGKGKEDDLIAFTLKDLEATEQVMGDMKNAWRTGDVAELTRLGITPMKEFDEDIYQQLAVKRNHNWLPKLRALFNNDKKELVLVGAMHLAGDDSVLKLLERDGFTITQLD